MPVRRAPTKNGLVVDSLTNSEQLEHRGMETANLDLKRTWVPAEGEHLESVSHLRMILILLST